MNSLLALTEGALTKTKLHLKEGLSLSEWKEIGKKLEMMGGAIQWWIGDWLNYGEKAYGEKYAEALSTMPYDVHVLYNMAYVAKSVRSSLRNEDLTWSHHKEVSALDSDQQKKWLQKAVDKSLSVRDLRDAVRKEEQPDLAQEKIKIAEREARLAAEFELPAEVRLLGGDRKIAYIVQLKFDTEKEVESFAKIANGYKR